LITVVIPALNEAAHIEGLLRQLLAEAPEDLAEIIVADGGSDDGTRDIVGRVASAEPRVKLLHNPARFQSAGVNLAAAGADRRSDILIRLDAHSGYPPGFVADLAKTLRRMEADSVVVRLRTQADGCFQKAVAAVSNSGWGTGGALHRVGGSSRWIDHGHHAAFTLASFTDNGGYDPSFRANEDAEYDVRLRRRQGRIWFAADLEVDYYPRRSARLLAKQYYNYGFGRARNFLKNRERLKLRHLAAPALTMAMALAVLASPLAPATLLFLAAYFLGAFLVGLCFASSKRDACLLLAVVALPCMHLGWGSGFLSAMARSLNGRAQPSAAAKA
jgi:succinoglycan biosynthesis protein ExoA